MKKVFCLVILYLISHFVLGQNRIDSLKNKLQDVKSGPERASILADICIAYRLTAPDSAIVYGDSAISLARKTNNPFAEYKALAGKSWAYNSMGNVSFSMTNAYKALDIGRNIKMDKTNFSMAYNAIGSGYRILKQFDKALEFYYREIALYKTDQPDIGNISGLLGLTSTYLNLHQLDSASFYLKRAQLMNEKLNYDYPVVMLILGNLEEEKGNLDKSLVFYRNSIERSKTDQIFRHMPDAYNGISRVFIRKNQRDSSIFYARKGLEAGKRLSRKSGIMESSELLAELYEPVDSKKALEYFKLAAAAREEVFGLVSIQSVESILSQEKDRQQELEAAKAAYKNQLRQYGLAGGLIALLIISILLYRNNRRKHKNNILLESQKAEIENALSQLKSTQAQLIQSEKMASLGELTVGIAHEIQNPLNFVNNFSEVNEELLTEMKDELNKGNIEDAKEIANDAIENQQKILHHGKRAEAIVKGMLQHSRQSTGKKEPTDINALCDEYLRLSYHGFRAKDKTFKVEIKTDFDNTIDKINMVPQDIGRVVLNLINNAFYAVNEKTKLQSASYGPRVIVQTKKINNNIEIRVADNGNGIPQNIVDKIFQPFFTTKPTGSGTGLGLSLSYDIVKAHGGELKVESEDGKGTNFIIHIPD